ncbi:Anti-anti-sigma regulatory factor (antagonist of anti-sigma factor) [Actinacidiphila rubida]|uniref:Anti-anti-sigma regulatory factor (Antagonist of anti-sigma factor) n=1 Tax=Actinacidiphila rubida TaxID=310780 RepID=A0A1H8QSD5_9ACTN|nr:MEDS domain-containing protein [Actinacidiphila rubida]SEO56966.1 Anti-anti-sigma regulatory factor (antagonist of anti-sigma factor) [Actinacidiphila rubida]
MAEGAGAFGGAGGARTPRTVAVERLGPGDHACLPFDRSEGRWALRAAFAAAGLARGERVLLFPGAGTDVSRTLERLDAHGVPALQAAADGRLDIVRTTPGCDPVRGFDPVARTDYWANAADDARTRGFTGLRAAGDMACVAEAGADAAALTSYELGLTPLLAKLGFTGLCEYDRHAFPPDVLDAVVGAHPLTVVPAPGTLHATRDGAVLRLAGDADLATRTAFELAVREPGLTAIDLTGLAFLDAHCARELVRLGAAASAFDAAAGSGGAGVALECTPAQARLLRLCGMRQPGHLVVRGEG